MLTFNVVYVHPARCYSTKSHPLQSITNLTFYNVGDCRHYLWRIVLSGPGSTGESLRFVVYRSGKDYYAEELKLDACYQEVVAFSFHLGIVRWRRHGNHEPFLQLVRLFQYTKLRRENALY